MRDTRGYTIAELLTVLFIIVIVGALIAPGMAGLMKRSKVASSVASVSGVLRTARTLAIARNDVYHVRAHTVGDEDWLSAVWVRDDDKRYLVPVPTLADDDYETLESGRLEEGTTLLPSGQALFFWPDGTASQEAVFAVQVEEPDEHDTPVTIRVRASGVVEELP